MSDVETVLRASLKYFKIYQNMKRNKPNYVRKIVETQTNKRPVKYCP